MGANAQTSVPTFTAGDVLTAANMNISARTGVPVFASTVTRDAGFGGTGEKTLAEGQMCYVEGTGFQTYNGTSWITWGTAPSSGALVVVKAETSFSGSSSVTADNVFTSSYSNYMLNIYYTSSQDQLVNMRFRTGGTSNSNATYQTVDFRAGLATATGRTDNATSAWLNYPGVTNAAAMRVTIFSPQLSEQTVFVKHGWGNSGGSTTYFTTPNAGAFTNTTSFDGIEIFPSSGTITGKYTIYGCAKS